MGAEALQPLGNGSAEQQEEEEHAPGMGGCASGRGQEGEVSCKNGDKGQDSRRCVVYGVVYEVPVKYVPGDPIGAGAYGSVCQARNIETGEEVAIKKIGNAFMDKLDARRTLREILLLRGMNHPNVMALKDVLRPANSLSFRDVYLVYELMPLDLHDVILSKQPMDERHYKLILYQLLKGVKYIHSANVLHRDLKPPNILIDARCNVKITDFGLARTRVGAEAHLTEYVVTRYYRAPELLVYNQDYTTAVDVWSIGLIYLELVTGKIVLKGDNYADQLRKTCELLGSPSPDEVGFIASEGARKFVLEGIPEFEKQLLKQVFPMLTPEGADLAQRMLQFDPRKRITVDEALKHPYLAQFYKPEQCTSHPNPFQYDLGFEQEEFDIPRIRQLIYEQSCIFNPA